MTTPHPQNFYVAHRLFPGKRGTAPAWGALTDGPEELDDVIARIWDMRSEQWGYMPTLEQVRVWHFQDDVPPRDVTEDVLSLMAAKQEAAE